MEPSVPFSLQSSIFIQTLREAPSDPHVQGLGKHVTSDRSPRDAHCSCDLLIVRAILLISNVESKDQKLCQQD